MDLGSVSTGYSVRPVARAIKIKHAGLNLTGQGSSFKQQATSWSIGLGRYARHALGIIPGETYRKPASHKQLDRIKFIVYRIVKD